MIKTYTCYTAACDVCGAEPESAYDGGGVAHLTDAEEALEQARYGEWWATEAAVLCLAGDAEHSARAVGIAADLARTDSGGEGIDDFAHWCGQSGYDIETPSHAETNVSKLDVAVGTPLEIYYSLPDPMTGHDRSQPRVPCHITRVDPDYFWARPDRLNGIGNNFRFHVDTLEAHGFNFGWRVVQDGAQ